MHVWYQGRFVKITVSYPDFGKSSIILNMH